jgi:hypothetical protein
MFEKKCCMFEKCWLIDALLEVEEGEHLRKVNKQLSFIGHQFLDSNNVSNCK